MFSLCPPFRSRGGYLPSGWWGGGYLLSGLDGGYLSSQVRVWEGTYLLSVGEGVPTLRSGWGGYLTSQVQVGGGYLPSGWWEGGCTYSGLDGGGYIPR